MTQMPSIEDLPADLDRRLDDAREAIRQGHGVVADDAYFDRLKERARRRFHPDEGLK